MSIARAWPWMVGVSCVEIIGAVEVSSGRVQWRINDVALTESAVIFAHDACDLAAYVSLLVCIVRNAKLASGVHGVNVFDGLGCK